MGTGMTKGGRDFLDLGNFNVMCAYCGRKRKATELRRDNEFARGLWCCPEHADDRHPQDYARGIKEDMSTPFVQPPIVTFVNLPAGFPLSITPSPAVLSPIGESPLVTETTIMDITTEGGSPLVTEPSVYSAYVTAVIPPWILNGPVGDPGSVYVTGIQWSWSSGGTGVTIASPNSVATFLYTTDPAAGGLLQCAVTDSLGQVSTAQVQILS